MTPQAIGNARLEDLTLLDPDIQECPFPLYERLLAEAPVYFDRKAGFWVISRYQDIRQILSDPDAFSSAASVEFLRDTVAPERAAMARQIYREKGWEPTPTLSLQDDPRHKETRAIFTRALRAGKINQLDPFIRDTAFDLVAKFKGRGTCDVIAELAVPLPLIAICSQVGVPVDDIWKIKRWTDAWVKRFSMMQTEQEERASIEQEIEFQHYFQPIIEQMRARPDESILSDLVNFRLSDGSQLEYADIVSHLLSDLFVGGSETSTNAIGEGILMLCQNPGQYELLMSDLSTYLPPFIEEVLRLQSPVQGLYRVTTREVQIGDAKIPARALLNLRFAAGNRDAAQFSCPSKLDLDRTNAGSHIAFGSGIHHCIGAPLARREMYWSFEALLQNAANIRLSPGKNDLSHMPGLMLRALKSLHIEFDPAGHAIVEEAMVAPFLD